MDFALLSDDKKSELAKLMLAPLNSPKEIKDWAKFYLDLEIPTENTDPDSTSNPLDAAWYIYETFKNNSGNVRPGAIMISCREGLKCQVKGTQILKRTGLTEIENIKIGDEIWTGFSWQKTTATFDVGNKPAIKVKVDGGLACIGTPIHRYWCLRDGTEQWIYSHNLNTETDLICVNIATGLSGNSVIEDLESYEIGYFLGLLTGDDGLSLIDKYGKFTLTTIDPYIKDFCYYFSDKYLQKSRPSCAKGDISYNITTSRAVNQIKEWGMSNKYSWEKEIPSFCYTRIDAMKGFIAGVFDTDGTYAAAGDMLLSMTAKKTNRPNAASPSIIWNRHTCAAQ